MAARAHDDARALMLLRVVGDLDRGIAEFDVAGVVGAGDVEQLARVVGGFLAFAHVVFVDHVLGDQPRQAGAALRRRLDVEQVDARCV